MPGTITQDGRLLSISTPLGKDVLLINNLHVNESVSGLFVIDVALCAELANASAVSTSAMIGQDATITLALPGGGQRSFSGIISRFSESDQDARFRFYQAQIVPWLWLFTLTSNCRIFQKLNVPDIIDKIVRERNVGEVRFALNRTDYTVRDYTSQYRETDFNFISRLMEDEGIFYFFEQKQDANSGKATHVMVIADSFAQVTPCPGSEKVCFQSSADPTVSAGAAGPDEVATWQKSEALRPGQYLLRDHHLELRRLVDEVPADGPTSSAPHSSFEVYDFPGDYTEKFNEPGQRLDKIHPEGQKIARVRMEEEGTGQQVHAGTSFCRGFSAGYSFELTGHPSTMDGTYVLTSVLHTAVQTPLYVSDQIGQRTSYINSFACSPEVDDNSQPARFRPARVTPKPVVQGLQTAVVVGKKGEEIYTDEFGRVKVQFHWDRDGKSDENSSCWIRVAQVWAGKKWGALFTPRIGQEVVVDFLEGDPDRPLITGSVYNAEQKVPYDQSAEMTKSTIKSNSTKGGVGFNEIRFEDKKGSEQLFIHAQQNMDVRVNGAEMESVGGDRHLTIGGKKDGKKFGDQKEMVYRDKHLLIHRDQFEVVGRNMYLTVGCVDGGPGEQHILIKDKKCEVIENGCEFRVKKYFHEVVEEGDRTTEVTKGSHYAIVDKGFLLQALEEIHLMSTKVVIEANAMLTLKVGGNFVNITTAGVDIKGTLVNINSPCPPAADGNNPVTIDTELKPPLTPDVPAGADDAKSGQKSARS